VNKKYTAECAINHSMSVYKVKWYSSSLYSISELRDVTIWITQCYLPPDTSE